MPAILYADTSAVAKLFIAETESSALRHWLSGYPDARLVSSEVLRVELRRLLCLVRPDSVDEADRFLANDIELVEIIRPTLTHAELIPPARLRALDAIHLATAFDLGPIVDVFVSYDRVLLDAARQAGFETAAPGA
jgi:uncharacterized protein